MFQLQSLGLPSPELLPNSSRCLPFLILEDDAFPLGINLMKPYPYRHQTQEQRIFSYRLSRARRVVEYAFGILANEFRIFFISNQFSTKKSGKNSTYFTGNA